MVKKKLALFQVGTVLEMALGDASCNLRHDSHGFGRVILADFIEIIGDVARGRVDYRDSGRGHLHIAGGLRLCAASGQENKRGGCREETEACIF